MTSTVKELVVEVVVGKLLLLFVVPRLRIVTRRSITILFMLYIGSSITGLVIVGTLFIVGALTGRSGSSPLSKVGSSRN